MKIIIKNQEEEILPSKAFSIAVFVAIAILISLLAFATSLPSSTVFNTAFAIDQQQPNIDASKLYQTETMVLGNNVKNLIILIPDESHHGPNETKDKRFIDQPFLPENAVINKGTTVAWFSADVNHEHNISVKDAKKLANVFDSRVFLFNNATKPLTFNNTGSFTYSDPNVSSESKGFVMKGTINVSDLASPLNASTKQNSTSDSSIDTVGIFMVPAKDLQTHISEFEKRGFTTDSSHTFTDLRGGQKGTGNQQTLLVWTSSGMDLNKVISALKEITPTLPYS